MNRLLLFLLLIYSGELFAQQTESIFQDVPAQTNPILIKRANAQLQQKQHSLIALLGKSSGVQKNNAEGLQDIVHIQSGKSLEVCLDTTAISGNFGSLNDQFCSNLLFGSIAIANNCFTYTATTGVVLGRDTVCLQLCDADNNCTDFVFPIEVRNPVAIPFFEDFSTSSIVPNPNLWQDRDVFINNTIGIQPPSIGMATFDGLNKEGRPYGGGHGSSDQLTSTFIDLNAFNAGDNVYLSYWVQPRGFGDRPEQIDSLVLEFKNEEGIWNTIAQFDGIPIDTPSTRFFSFQKQSYRITADEYFHDGFQFRFTNYSTNSGAIDLWHLDYITIYPNQTASADLRDIAFTRVPEPIIREYAAIPWRHFLEGIDELLRDSLRVELFNHFNQTAEARSSFAIIEEKVTNSALTVEDLLLPTQEDIPADMATRYDNPFSNFAFYKSALENNFLGQDSLVVEVFYGFDQNDEEREATDNNIVRRETVFHDYFAYDDGSAETNIIAQNTGTEIGVEFFSYVEDSLRAISVNFVNVTGANLNNELFNLKIYLDTLDSEPEFENILLKPIYANSLFDSLQAFTTYALIDQSTDEPMAVPIPANTKFYIGIQTASTNEIPIGFDRNNLEAAKKNWVALSSGWFPFPQTHQGAVMLRAIFSQNTPLTTSTIDIPIEEISSVMNVYPNPTPGVLHFQSEDDLSEYQYITYNSLGQVVQRGQLMDELNLINLEDGIYFMQIFKDRWDRVYHHKFILSQ